MLKNNILFKIKNYNYNIFINNNIIKLKKKLNNILKKYKKLNFNIVIITDYILDFLYFTYFKNIFLKNIYKYVILEGEKFKNLCTVNKIINYLLINDCSKNTILISIGGGVISDLTGFIASIYKRGIPYINIPTTLLAQIDAAIGGKTAINHKLGKNLIGSIHQPSSTLINLCFLKSLSKRQFNCGMGEMIKYSILNKKFFKWINNNIIKVINLNLNSLKYSIFTCCNIKNKFISNDLYEIKNKRIFLNLGHTFAHSIETFFNYSNKYLHGEAVSIGIMMSLYTSILLGNIKLFKITNKIKKLLQLSSLPIKGPDNMLFKDYLYNMKFDKKNKLKNKLSLIIPYKIGKCKLKNNIKSKILITAINFINI